MQKQTQGKIRRDIRLRGILGGYGEQQGSVEISSDNHGRGDGSLGVAALDSY